MWSAEFRCSPFYKLHSFISNIAVIFKSKKLDGIEVMISRIYYDTYTLHFSYEGIGNVFNIRDGFIKNEKFIEELKEKIASIDKSHKDNPHWEESCRKIQDVLKELSPEELPEELLKFFFSIPSPILWYEEGIAYRLLQADCDPRRIKCESKSQRYKCDPSSANEGSRRNLSKVFFSMGGAKKGERKIEIYDQGSDESGEGGEHYEKTKLTGQEESVPEAVKQLFSILLKVFGANNKEAGTLTIEEACQGDMDYSARHSFIVPIWQNYINGEGYGGACGFINIYINHQEKQCSEKKHIGGVRKEISEHIFPQLAYLSNELFVSSMFAIQNLGYKLMLRKSVVDLFLILITRIQDWKNIWIVDKGDNIIQCWGRENKGFNWVWQEQEKEKNKELTEPPGRLKFKFNDVFFDKDDEIEHPFMDAAHIIFEPAEVFSYPAENNKHLFENRLLEQCRTLVRLISNRLEQCKYAERLASSAIMARNMSHNIGSHVLTKTISETQGNEANLFRYLQMRMEHLADVATWQKNKDLRSLNFLDIQKNLIDEQKELLLKYISGEETNTGVPLECKGKLCVWNEGDQGYEEVKEHEAIYVAVPNGNIGVHAFYVLIENFVRNVAKHNSIKAGPLEFCVGINEEFDDKYADMIEVRLWQNSVTEKVGKLGEIESRIKESLIQENFQPRTEAWGIGEMVLSAQYLRQDNYVDLGILEVRRASVTKDSGSRVDKYQIYESASSGDRILYRFYMQKPKEVAIVVDKGDEDFQKIESETQKKMERCGVKFIDKQSMSDAKNYRRVVLLSEGISQDERNDLPLRTFLANGHHVCVAKDKLYEKVGKYFNGTTDPFSFFNYLDEQWCSFLGKRHGIDNMNTLFLPSFHRHNPDNILQAKQTKKILYWRHHLGLYQDQKKLYQTVVDNNNNNPYFFVEIYTAQSNMEALWQRNFGEAQTEEKFYGYEFTSAALTKVVILDDRIQSEVNKYREEIKNNREEVMYPKHAIAEERNRVFVPRITDSGNLYSPEWEKIKCYIKKVHKKDDPIDCIVIHLSILQKLQDANNRDIDDYLKELKGEGKENIYGETPPLSVRVCTGRGNVPGNADRGRMIPFSELNRWLSSSSPSKYHLYRLLNL